MRIDISYRLIEKLIKRGGGYVCNLNPEYARITNPEYIPLCVYATREYKKSDIIHILQGRALITPIEGSIKINESFYIYDNYGKYLRCSKTPNACISENKIIAIKNIEKLEEITIGEQ